MYPFEAIIWDVDGTLADTERDGHRRAFNAAFAEAGLDWCWDVATYGELLEVTGGRERIAAFIVEHRPALPAGVEPETLAVRLHRAKSRHYARLLAAGAIGLRPGVLRLLRAARTAGIRLAIATTSTPENVHALLAHAGEPGLTEWFEVIAAGDMVANKKPAPDVYLLALERLGLGADACVAVEDSAPGLRAARAAGLGTVVITVNDYTREQAFDDAALVVDGLGAPETPVSVLHGRLGGRSHVDLAALADLVRARHPETS
ncbi:HAD-IA family hydrolase [Marichromatium gracile]|uniref:HAD superfamily hydrolase (TIGR01509 family) n=1 Tax=Marichromatium gracile TaxID=1048 RepID=A0A4R4AE80_MARGR|nr:HAD-IA family hydrolase [Marichromatium gracile]MBK1709456.1 phosphatase [Marichromatium gracile]MBO8084591.1 HAD-IA family hydrolase [Marichromatium sp.]TCW36956.1 HAD superfamily hydrolase (TIGR01509 family) [Marichromatium gracile]